jgi:hypothetical protein
MGGDGDILTPNFRWFFGFGQDRKVTRKASSWSVAVKRRTFLQSTTTVAGGILVGVGTSGCAKEGDMG